MPIKGLDTALKKKQIGNHPDAKADDKESRVKAPSTPTLVNKPQKKVTGRGR